MHLPEEQLRVFRLRRTYHAVYSVINILGHIFPYGSLVLRDKRLNLGSFRKRVLTYHLETARTLSHSVNSRSSRVSDSCSYCTS